MKTDNEAWNRIDKRFEENKLPGESFADCLLRTIREDGFVSGDMV